MKIHHLDFWYVGQRMLCDDGWMWQLLHFSFSGVSNGISPEHRKPLNTQGKKE